MPRDELDTRSADAFLASRPDSSLPSTPRNIERRLHDHEVLLSFNGDFDAECFLDWWNGGACQEWKSYLLKRHEENRM